MADNERGSQHFFLGVLQNATWDALKRALGGGTLTAFGAGVYQYLRHRSVDWWGLLGLGILTALMLWLGRKQATVNKEPSKQIDPPSKPPVVDDSEADRLRREDSERKAELWRVNESRRLCDEERREALKQLEEAKSQLAIFTPLQMRAFEIANEIQTIIKDAGDEPEMSAREHADGDDGIFRWNDRRWRWEIPHISKYDVQLKSRVAIVVSDFWGENANDIYLDNLYGNVKKMDDLKEIRKRLIRLALKVDGINLEVVTK